jgi:AbrB family looped-hinge helix DNA binding protein
MGASAKVTSKGQITIPVEIRRIFGIEPGDEVVFFKDLDGQPRFRVRRWQSGPIDPLMVWDGPPVPVEAMDPGLSDEELAVLMTGHRKIA